MSNHDDDSNNIPIMAESEIPIVNENEYDENKETYKESVASK